MFHGTIITVKNISDEDIVDSYDSQPFTFPVGRAVSLPEDSARFFLGRHGKDFEVVKEQRGAIEEGASVALVNHTEDTLTTAYSGVEYVFEPGKPVPVPKELAPWLMDRSHLQGKLEIAQAKAPAAPKTPKTPATKKPAAAEKPGKAKAPAPELPQEPTTPPEAPSN